MFTIFSRLMVILLLAAFSLWTADAHAAEGGKKDRGFYGAASLGWSGISDYDYTIVSGGTGSGSEELDDTSVFRFAFGYQGLLTKNIRLEVESSSASYESKVSTDFSVGTMMLNTYYDFDFGNKVVPYVGAGLGAATVSDNGAGDDTTFAYQAKAGLAVPVSSRWDVTFGGTYTHINDTQIEQNLTTATPGAGMKVALDDFDQYSVDLGARYRF
ncbi:MAG: outer membrane protein [Alphaproteobacteria bacterium]